MALVREDVHVCNAVMGFKALAQGESMAQRVLMYPSEWDREDEEGGKKGGSRETSRRLLRAAAKQYKVMLQPIRPVPASIEGADDDTTSTSSTSQWSPEEQYPLTNLLSLLTFNRIIYLPPSGLLLDASPLDLLFTLPMEEEKDSQQQQQQQQQKRKQKKHANISTSKMLGLSDPLSRTNDAAVLLIEPSKKLYTETLASLPEGAYADSEFFARVKTHVAPSSPSSSSSSSKKEGADATQPDGSGSGSDSSNGGVPLVVETGSLRDGISSSSNSNTFNSTLFLSQTAYARLRDDGLRGPEFDLPPPGGPQREEIWPHEGEARRAWRELYERYRVERMEVCGLDLEPWGGVGEGGKGGEGEGQVGSDDSGSEDGGGGGNGELR